MANIIIDHDTIEYIGECIYAGMNNHNNFKYTSDSGITIPIFYSGNYYNDLHNAFKEKSLFDVIKMIEKSNLSKEYQKKIIQDLTIIIITTQNTIFTERIDELEKMVHCQNDKINILIDALDLANQNNINTKK